MDRNRGSQENRLPARRGRPLVPKSAKAARIATTTVYEILEKADALYQDVTSGAITVQQAGVMNGILGRYLAAYAMIERVRREDLRIKDKKRPRSSAG